MTAADDYHAETVELRRIAIDLQVALEHALTFLESLPKGWLAKTSGDIGALNDFYLTAPKALAKAKGII